ncbi:MAG: NAD(P)-dependent oxidoreductase [bacterium]
MKILLTGATGFIGKNLLDFLGEHEVYCLVRNSEKYEKIKRDNTRPVYGDLTALDGELPEVEVIIHLAGLIRGRKSQYYKVNGGGMKNLVEKARRLKNLKKFIYVSSQAAAGPGTLENPKKENEIETPVSDYGLSKLLGEKILKESGLPYLILRPVSVYGAGDRDVFFAFRMVQSGIVFLPSGKRFVNLVSVFDVCGGIMKAVDTEAINDTFFLSCPQTLTYDIFIKTIAEKMRKKILIIKVPEGLIRLGGIAAEVFAFLMRKPALLNVQKVTEINTKYWVVDHSRLLNVLGYKPQYPLVRGVEETLAWYRLRRWL